MYLTILTKAFRHYVSHLAAGACLTRLLSLAKIAKVTFISKIVEKLVALQLISYLDSNKLILSSQSGFHKGHSTETLLLRLLSEIYGHQQSQLTLLDMMLVLLSTL